MKNPTADRPRALGSARGRLGDRSGQSLVEFLIVAPLLLLLFFGIVELGAAWRTYQVVTNTAREGARRAVVPDAEETDVRTAVDQRLTQGGLDPAQGTVDIICSDVCFGPARPSGSTTEIRIAYPHAFVFLGPIVEYVTGGGGDTFGTITMQTGILMRNE